MTARIVVVGNGMAGFRFVQELLGLSPGFDVTVVGEEPGGAYNRVQLPNVLAGAASPASIELADEGWYPARGVTLRAGVAAVRIDRARRLVHLAAGPPVRYDALVLATGSSAVLPPAAVLVHGGPADGGPADGGPVDGGPVDGRAGLVPGAVAFRTRADCEEIQALAARTGRAVVLGGGVLGLETARALAGDGLHVTLVQRGRRLMERQLDADASRVLARTVRTAGITVRAGAQVRRVRRDGGGVTGGMLDDGSVLEAGLLVLCCGTRPRAGLARRAGLAADTGVIVDDQLRSISDPAVFAIGDCAQHRGQTHGLVAPSWAQARVAASVIAGHDTRASYTGSAAVIRLKAAGVELAVLGAAGGRGAEVIRFADPARGVYQKLVVRDGRLAGAILLGDTRAAGTLTQLLDRGAPLPADRSSLLIVRRNAPATTTDAPTALPAQATICQCNGVTKAAICAAWQDGAREPAQIASRTRATTGCGTCGDAVQEIADWLAAADAGLAPV